MATFLVVEICDSTEQGKESESEVRWGSDHRTKIYLAERNCGGIEDFLNPKMWLQEPIFTAS